MNKLKKEMVDKKRIWKKFSSESQQDQEEKFKRMEEELKSK